MNNLITYDEFLNEGLFTSSRYEKLLTKLREHIDKMNPDDIGGRGRIFTFTIKKSAKNPDDPYGEENWGDDINIRVELRVDDEGDKKYSLYINDEIINVSKGEAKSLWKYINHKKESYNRLAAARAKKQKDVEEEERIKKYLDAL